MHRRPAWRAQFATLRVCGIYVLFLLRTITALGRGPGQGARFTRQLHRIGTRSLPVIAVAGTLAGMMIAVQS
jgi:ABC-type transporter Mla maintaining outer membrane lipid asymmetry permease subunit MlaE